MTDPMNDPLQRAALLLDTHERRLRTLAKDEDAVAARERLLALAKKSKDTAQAIREIAKEAVR